MATSLTTEIDSSKLPVVIHNHRGISLSTLQSLASTVASASVRNSSNIDYDQAVEPMKMPAAGVQDPREERDKVKVTEKQGWYCTTRWTCRCSAGHPTSLQTPGRRF